MPVSDLQWPSEVDPTREKAPLCYWERRRRLTFIANVTEITVSSRHVFKIQSQTRPNFALAFKLFKGQTLVNTGRRKERKEGGKERGRKGRRMYFVFATGSWLFISVLQMI